MDSTETQVGALLDRWSAAIRAKDIDRLMDLYAPDSVYFDLVPPLQIVGSDAIRRNFLRFFASYQGAIGQEVRDLHMLASGEVAVAYMLIRASGTLANGREVSYWVRATVGCYRSDDQWLIRHEHVSLPVDLASGRVVMDLLP